MQCCHLSPRAARPGDAGDFGQHGFRCFDVESGVAQRAFDECRRQAFRVRVIENGRQQIERREARGHMCVIDHEVVHQPQAAGPQRLVRPARQLFDIIAANRTPQIGHQHDILLRRPVRRDGIFRDMPDAIPQAGRRGIARRRRHGLGEVEDGCPELRVLLQEGQRIGAAAAPDIQKRLRPAEVDAPAGGTGRPDSWSVRPACRTAGGSSRPPPTW
jgi:hypothetical protein